MRSCNGYTCRQLPNISFDFGKKIYENNIKFCKACDKFMKITVYRCPCCKSNLRCKSHCSKWRK